MKKIKNIFRTTLIVATMFCGAMLTSCTDFLTVYPANSTIQENFWQTAEDVKGILATSYLELASENAVERMIIWGELRADNMNVREGKSKTYTDIAEYNLKEDNGFCSWAKFYSAINYANLVLEFASQVVDRDPNFTEGDLDIIRGEMYTMRALAHFYLVRTFRDIPLSYKASLDDSELPDYPQVHPMVALDSIMSDLDKAEKLTMSGEYSPAAYGSENNNYNNGRLNRNAVYALKADVNLWRAAFAEYYLQNGDDSNAGQLAQLIDENVDADGSTEGEIAPGEGSDDTTDDTSGDVLPDDTPSGEIGEEVVTILSPDEYYRMAIENCDSVIERMNRSMKKYYTNIGISESQFEALTLENPYHLCEEGVYSSSSLNTPKTSIAYSALFGELKSQSSTIDRHEIIFELKYDGHTNKNTAVTTLYGKSDDAGICYVSDDYVSNATSKYHKNDYRYYAYTRAEDLSGNTGSNTGTPSSFNPGGKIGIAKYSANMAPGYEGGFRTDPDANWVIYRKTDVMLMKAEALTQLSSVTKQKMYDAFHLVKAVNDRSLMVEKDSLKEPQHLEDLQEMVLDERVRELTFEGKRWFDLVRVALRSGSTTDILFVTDKLGGSAGTAAKKKMQTINSLFFPIYKSELNANPLLVQNPVYEQSSSIEQN